MPSISSPVFSCSLTGWAIEKTKTVNDGISSAVGRYAVTLAVSAVVLPIFAVLDVVLFTTLACHPLGWVYPISNLLKAMRTILFVVQLPLVLIANIFGANLLPKVNYSRLDFMDWADGSGCGSGNQRHEEDRHKLKHIINQYTHGDIDFEEFLKIRMSKNPKDWRGCPPENNGISLLDFDWEDQYSAKESVFLCLATKIEHQSVVDKFLGKKQKKKNQKTVAAHEVAASVNNLLEETLGTLVTFVIGAAQHEPGTFSPCRKREMLRGLDAVVCLTERIDQTLGENTQKLLEGMLISTILKTDIQKLLFCDKVTKLDKVKCEILYKVLPAFLTYVKRTGDIESGNKIKKILENAMKYDKEHFNLYQEFRSKFTQFLNAFEQHKTARLQEVRANTPLMPDLAAIAVTYYEI